MPELTLELRTAAERDDAEAIDALIEAGGNPNAKNLPGNSALHAAAYRGAVGAIGALLAAGADREARNVYGTTALVVSQFEDHLICPLMRRALWCDCRPFALFGGWLAHSPNMPDDENSTS